MLSYTLKRSLRTRSMRLRVLPGGVVEVTAPWWTGGTLIEQFVARYADKITEAMARMVHVKTLPVSGRRAYLKHKEDARDFITERVRHWNQFYGHTYERISIKDTKRAWGSCSNKNNLNFSYLLLFLPPELADYIVVHELCHLKEHNHSPRFWALVAHAVPDYKARRSELRKFMLK
jgi:predicted metal-dependent hydrolase